MKDKLNKIQAILRKAKTLGSHLAEMMKIENGAVTMTDGRRMVTISGVDMEDGLLGGEKFPVLTEDHDNALVMWEGDIDFASFCSEHNLMKAGVHHVIMFNGEFVHYRRGTECVVNVEKAKIGAMSSEFFADVLRFHRILSGTREKSCVFRMKIIEVRSGAKRIILEKESLRVVIASNDTTCYYADGVVLEYELEKKNVF